MYALNSKYYIIKRAETESKETKSRRCVRHSDKNNFQVTHRPRIFGVGLSAFLHVEIATAYVAKLGQPGRNGSGCHGKKTRTNLRSLAVNFWVARLYFWIFEKLFFQRVATACAVLQVIQIQRSAWGSLCVWWLYNSFDFLFYWWATS